MQFDPEGFGEIPWEDFERALRSAEFRRHIAPHKLEQLEQKLRVQLDIRRHWADEAGATSGATSAAATPADDGRPPGDRRPTSAITFQDFVNVVSLIIQLLFSTRSVDTFHECQTRFHDATSRQRRESRKQCRREIPA